LHWFVGFGPDDAIKVVRWLNEYAVDLAEISGGSYESPAMQGSPESASTREREAYFIDFARDIVAAARMPVMVTGGIRRRAVAEAALTAEDGRPGVAIVGIGRALAYDPDLPAKWLHGELAVELPSVSFKKKALNNVASMALAKLQLRRMGDGLSPKSTASPLFTLVAEQIRTKTRSKEYRRWLAQRER
jgi:2,4-dienoyl-CoA reductase-like NADH-dependent reductase (Old Yellow Enzyme family)